MALKRSARGAVAPFIVMDVLREANRREAEGGDVLHLEVGQPSTGAPSKVIEAARRILTEDRLGYTEALGIDPLRARIAAYYRDMHGLDVDPDRIVVTTGSSGGFMLAFLSAFDAGDRIALAEPGYPAYRNILQALDLEVVGVPATAAERYQPVPAALERLDGPIPRAPC